MRRGVTTYHTHIRFASERAALPGILPGAGRSDHGSFWLVGYPVLGIFETAPFRYADCHQDTDAPATLDNARLARMADGLATVVADLCSGRSALTADMNGYKRATSSSRWKINSLGRCV